MANQLPGYITAAKPNPIENRAPWYKNTAQTYAGIFLWFVFWTAIVNGPAGKTPLSAGLGACLVGLVIAAALCHWLFYLAPGLFGMKSGLPLGIVGTSTFGSIGGFLLPGFLMGVLQFGWLGVNAFFASQALTGSNNSPAFYVLCILWAGGAAFIGLVGIQYVAKVSTFLPLIPFLILLAMLVSFGGSAMDFEPSKLASATATSTQPAAAAMSPFAAIAFIVTYVVGFFATAGAAGVDICMSARNGQDVNRGGLGGIFFATVFTGGISMLTVAGIYAAGHEGLAGMASEERYVTTSLLGVVWPGSSHKWIMIGLSIAAFPGACFSSFVAASSFKATLAKVNPFVSVGIGAAVSILLAVTHIAGDAIGVFKVIGASFGPICGAMTVDYLLSGRKWPGPRAGFNIPGWVAWAVGFAVGIIDLLEVVHIPAAPVAAYIVGAVLYFVLAKAGLESPVVPLPAAEGAAEPAAEGEASE